MSEPFLEWIDLFAPDEATRNAIFSAASVIVFGSRARGCWTPQSDLDLLCSGHGRRIRTPAIDVTWMSPEQLASERWLESELATHIATYGVALSGDASWLAAARITARTVENKRRALLVEASVLEEHWHALLPSFRAYRIECVRRQLQRLDLLAKGHPVPPTAILEKLWKREPVDIRRAKELLPRNTAARAVLRRCCTGAY